jgi:hypothetical protein
MAGAFGYNIFTISSPKLSSILKFRTFRCETHFTIFSINMHPKGQFRQSYMNFKCSCPVFLVDRCSKNELLPYQHVGTCFKIFLAQVFDASDSYVSLS